MTLALGSDHGGFNLKEAIKKHLEDKGMSIRDFGTCSLDSVDYPDIAKTLAHAVAKGECDKGILICGTGIGISIAANKVKGIRAALCHDVFSAQMSREHNNANILALGERVVGPGLALMIVDTWLAAEFSGGRHERRVEKISAIEGYCDRNNLQPSKETS
jgi:ribose 5-phosphate isomerase B